VNDYFIDIWTNGSISPNEALESAAQIIIDLFTLLINNKNINEIIN
jgi:DNA-directed RNA polymerase alpha subunit